MLRNELPLPSREEAQERGFSHYGEASPIYVVDEAGQPTDVFKGTRVAISRVESDSPMDITVVDREYFHFDRTFDRAVRKEVNRAAKYIARASKAKRLTSYVA